MRGGLIEFGRFVCWHLRTLRRNKIHLDGNEMPPTFTTRNVRLCVRKHDFSIDTQRRPTFREPKRGDSIKCGRVFLITWPACYRRRPVKHVGCIDFSVPTNAL